MPQYQTTSPSSFLAALLLSIPSVGIILAAVVYTVYGLTGDMIHPYFQFVTGLFLYFIIGLWSIFGSEHTSEVAYRLCRLGAILALLLPIATAFVSLAWGTGSAVRPSDLLPGLTAFEIPILSAGIALVLILLFFFGSFLAARNIDGVPF